MLRFIQNSSSTGAKHYFSTADYYSEGQELEGRWHGKAAAMLGLSEGGVISRSDWEALCDNKEPSTGKRLTPRTKSNRRVGYDINFHPPKSVSLLYAVTGDERILDAFRESVDCTMRAMEDEMLARVRTKGTDEDRVTGNMVWGEYVHLTSRPVGGEPDPQLHAHCFTFNVTHDAVEGRWKAGQFGDLKRDAPYFEAVFDSDLAWRLESLGLPVERVRKGRGWGWEIAGIGKGTLDRFSRRTAQIEERAKAKGITDAAEKAELGAKTREKKAKHLKMDELRGLWKARLNEAELGALGVIESKIGSPRVRGVDHSQAGVGEAPATPSGERAHVDEGCTAVMAADYALEHCFARRAVVPERVLLATALRRGVGAAAREEIEKEVASREFIRAERDGQVVVTTPEVLGEEKRMLDFARKGRGAFERLGKDSAEAYTFRREYLNREQRAAVLHLLRSRDRVTLIRGAAGVGKTTAMKEAVEAIEATGARVFAFAPSSEASRGVLKEQERFKQADTVARLLVDPKLQNMMKGEAGGNVIWIDEAGQLGTRDMTKVFDLAGELGARVVVSGDRRQHGSVERGAVLRLLETEAGLVPAEIREIQRQQARYKDAVRDLSEGEVERAFNVLDELGWIREAPQEFRGGILARDYVESVQQGKSTLIVSPTHAEGTEITQAVRSSLKTAGRLGHGEREFRTLENLNLTSAELRDPLSYAPSRVAVFHQNAKGYAKGQRVYFDADAPLPLDQVERFQLYKRGSVQIAPGETLRITRNGKTVDGKHSLLNGTFHTVKGFTPSGDLVLQNDWVVGKDYGHLAHGYVVTSYASQGKSVDRVLIAQSARSLPASSKEQFYVSVSRGKEAATIYTDNKQELLEAVRSGDDRLTATELQRMKERAHGLTLIRGGLIAAARKGKDAAPAVEMGNARGHASGAEHRWSRDQGVGRELR